MSAAAARRRKQLRQKSTDELAPLWDTSKPLDESSAYEVLQLAQSQVRKTKDVALAFKASKALLEHKQVSVASSMLTMLVELLVETETAQTSALVDQLLELDQLQAAGLKDPSKEELARLHRLHREWLRACVNWSSSLGDTHFGDNRLHAALGRQCWTLAQADDEEDDEWMGEAVQHMALAEEPAQLLEWFKTLPAPTEAETKSGHTVPPGVRDGLLTRAVILMVAVENLRDANTLVRGYMEIEERDIAMLQKSYTSKDDGLAPSHIIFCCMLLRICEKDRRTGALFSWLLRSFKRELDFLNKSVMGSATKIGKVYFGIEPPPSMLNMMENMMGMMGGGGGMNPAMMQAAMAQMQGM